MKQRLNTVDGAVLVLGDDDSGNQRLPYLTHKDGWWHILMSGNEYQITDQVFDALIHRAYIKSVPGGKDFAPTRLCMDDAKALLAEQRRARARAQ